jgi:acyl-CoA synthetase (AMP-forming)/AMP-acid ligase II
MADSTVVCSRTQVENAIMKYGPDVAMCAVIGTPDAKFGEIVTAIVVPAPGKRVVAEQIVSHCRSLIAGFKVPRQVVIREALPMSGAGKILKNELRKEFRTDALGNVNSIKVASKL